MRLAGAWERRGRRVMIVTGSDEGPARHLLAPGVDVITARPQVAGGLFYRLRLAKAFAAIVRRERPSIVFGIGNFHVSVLAAMKLMLRRQSPALVCRLSNALQKPGLGSFGQATFTTMVRNAARRIDAVVTMSEALRQEARFVLRREDVHFIWEPYFDHDEVPLPPRAQMSPLMLCAARLEPQKRLDLALHAVAELSQRRKVRLRILGEGSMRSALERETDRLDLRGTVEFAGYVSDIRPHLQQAEVLVCTSAYEGYPAALVEAIAAGVRVLTTNCSPAVSEIMFDRSFGTVVADDASAVAGGMENLLDAPRPDEAARASIVNRHMVSVSADEYLAFFDSVVSHHNA
jgi:glycosyltransferase involved in cell wall biosynthesis